MSFSYDVKETIIKTQYKSSCCGRALLQGVLVAKGHVDGGHRIYINIENANVINFVAALINDFFGREAEVSRLPKGGRGKRLSFESRAMANFLLSIDNQSSIFNRKCASCQSAFLKGLFLAVGRVTDPSKQFCLEFSLGNRTKVLMNYFDTLGMELKYVSRRSEELLYTKNSTVIEDFFASADLNDVAYAVMNTKIENEFSNNANRLRNFDTVNISKAVDAANPQYVLIKKLTENNLMGLLPEELRDTARMRLENPDMSLSQLAIHSVPPISKSGITHRMERIMKLGKELIVKYNL